jgi:hypothetical protein
MRKQRRGPELYGNSGRPVIQKLCGYSVASGKVAE